MGNMADWGWEMRDVVMWRKDVLATRPYGGIAYSSYTRYERRSRASAKGAGLAE